MRLTRIALSLCLLSLPATASSQEAGRATAAPSQLPSPVLVFTGTEDYEADGKQWTRYKYTVGNLADYPNELFAAAPELPPCGQNTKASRTWVDLYQVGGKRLHGFCALDGRDGLGKLWFAVESGAVPPSWVFVELHDRKADKKYKSNLAETTQ